MTSQWDENLVPGRLVDVNRCVCIELGDTRGSDLVAGLADVLSAEEELGREIGDGDRRRIVEGEALDTSKGNVLGNLDTETLEADNEHVGSAHALHGLVAQDIELAAVEGLIDLGGAHDRLVDLHPGDEVDLLGELLVLRWVRG